MLSHGQVLEEGTHDDLYAMMGIYHRLVEAQHISAEVDEGTEKESELEHSEAYLAHFRTANRDVAIPDTSTEYKRLVELGSVEERHYSLWRLIRKVSFLLVELTLRRLLSIGRKENGSV